MTSATPISFYNSRIEISPDGTTWTDVSGYSSMLSVSGGDRAIGKFFNFSDDVPQLTPGKRDSLEIALKIALTQANTDADGKARIAYETGAAFYVRWTPGLFASGQKQFTSGKGIVKSYQYPQGGAESSDPLVLDSVVAVPSITKGLATT